MFLGEKDNMDDVLHCFLLMSLMLMDIEIEKVKNAKKQSDSSPSSGGGPHTLRPEALQEEDGNMIWKAYRKGRTRSE
jgi:hypothetical protein